MKFFYCKSARGRSGRWADAAARAKSGISLVGGESRVYSIHRHLDLSSVTDSLGNNDEEIAEFVSNESGDGAVTTLQHDQREPNPLEEEIEGLKRQIASLQESKHELEDQLSTYNFSLKEKESFAKELQSLMEGKAAQIEILCRKIESLQGKNLQLERIASEHAFLKSEVESMKLKAKETNGKIRRNWRKKKEAFARLQQRMTAQKSIETEMLSREIEMKNDIEGLRGEIEELKRTNLELLNDKIKLMNKLNCITESINVEKEATEKATKEVNRLKIANAKLRKQIDSYRTDRRNDVEELIYLRWINACLKHELQTNHGSKDRILGTIKHEKRDARMVNAFGNNDLKRNISGYDSEGSSIPTEASESCKDMNSEKRSKVPKGKMLFKIKNWMNNEKNNKKIHDEDSCNMSGDFHKMKAQDSDAYANASSCGRLDYAIDVSVFPRSSDFLPQIALI